MRLRPLALAAVAALILLAGCKNSDLPPSPPALIIGTRDRVNPFRMTLTTDPTWPKASGPTLIKVHIIDGSNQPVEGVELKADISMPGMAQHTSFDDRGKGDYETQVTLEMAGNWDVDLNASKDGRTKQQRLNIEVGN